VDALHVERETNLGLSSYFGAGCPQLGFGGWDFAFLFLVISDRLAPMPVGSGPAFS